jgi:hypothetical protein
MRGQLEFQNSGSRARFTLEPELKGFPCRLLQDESRGVLDNEWFDQMLVGVVVDLGKRNTLRLQRFESVKRRTPSHDFPGFVAHQIHRFAHDLAALPRLEFSHRFGLHQ